MMEITEVRHTALGTFTIVHEVKPHKAWRIPRLPNGKARCPKVEPRVVRPAPRLIEGEKFMKALKLRAELVAKLEARG
jgi:hypothetical protein